MKKTDIRKPSVAGQFYPEIRAELIKEIKSFTADNHAKSDIIGCILPHAGYMYSGKVATEAVSRINIKNKIILLGPNHTGYGEEFSIMTSGTWQTPLGNLQIDSALAGQLLKESKYLKEDYLAHTWEHSIEVELPILQYFKENFEIIPICIKSANIAALKDLGQEIAATLKKLNIQDSVMLLASSDMTHYETQESAKYKDMEAIRAILDLDEDKLAEKIKGLNITMCGYAPVITLITAAKQLGAQKAELIKYQTSGDITGDKISVVGYASLIIK